jgi:hypothetical protein
MGHAAVAQGDNALMEAGEPVLQELERPRGLSDGERRLLRDLAAAVEEPLLSRQVEMVARRLSVATAAHRSDYAPPSRPFPRRGSRSSPTRRGGAVMPGSGTSTGTKIDSIGTHPVRQLSNGDCLVRLRGGMSLKPRLPVPGGGSNVHSGRSGPSAAASASSKGSPMLAARSRNNVIGSSAPRARRQRCNVSSPRLRASVASPSWARA